MFRKFNFTQVAASSESAESDFIDRCRKLDCKQGAFIVKRCVVAAGKALIPDHSDISVKTDDAFAVCVGIGDYICSEYAGIIGDDYVPVRGCVPDLVVRLLLFRNRLDPVGISAPVLG